MLTVDFLDVRVFRASATMPLTIWIKLMFMILFRTNFSNEPQFSRR